MADSLPDDPVRRQEMIQVLTTEHFTLQGARSSAVAETNSRLQIYMGFVSMTVLALALVAQVSKLGQAFFAFAYLLFPVAYLFGVVTQGRLRQSWVEWFVAGQGMARIRRFFVDAVPEARLYLSLPVSDEPWVMLGGIGIRIGPFRGLVTAHGVIGLINSVLAGAMAGLVTIRIFERGAVATASAVGAFLLSLVIVMGLGRRDVMRKIAAAEVRFPESQAKEQ